MSLFLSNMIYIYKKFAFIYLLFLIINIVYEYYFYLIFYKKKETHIFLKLLYYSYSINSNWLIYQKIQYPIDYYLFYFPKKMQI